MILKEKRSFNISKGSSAVFQHQQTDKIKQIQQIKYYSDAVFNPITYHINFKVTEKVQKAQCDKDNEQRQRHEYLNKEQVNCKQLVQLDFQFLKQQTKNHKRIFDNIGVIVISYKTGNSRKFGILVTNQQDQIFVSLIQ